ncbi:V-type ATP synthase subunit B [Candidatus Bathyarchaeota archaeon]|nr:V-type ATP synthase subunit B [Candidatus Bathyarchaeota archaeon]
MMSVSYTNIEKIIGPLIYLRNNHDTSYGEVVSVHTPDGKIRMGEVIEISKESIIIEVFGETDGISATNTRVTFKGEPFKVKLSTDMIGKVFNYIGEPIDISTRRMLPGKVISSQNREIEGSPINPCAREAPREIIQTGISAIDGLFTLIKGQKLPIFSGQGMPHNRLAAQIVTQASSTSEKPFLIIFCGIGILQDEAAFFLDEFKRSGKMQHIISFLNFADDPIMERLIIPHVSLTAAEYFAYDLGMDVLVVLIDITNYAEALRELSSAKEEIPSRKGYPGYLYSNLAALYERTGCLAGKQGSITQIPILSMPNDDISHPIPDTTGFITEGQVVLNRDLFKRNLYPPVEVLASISRLMKDAIGERTTRKDHADISSQAIASYSEALEIRSLISIVGEEGLKDNQNRLLDFARSFEQAFLRQDIHENRTLAETFSRLWESLSKLSRHQLTRVHREHIDEYYQETW